MIQDTEYKVLSEQIKGLTTLINAQFEEVHDRLDKINGKVAKHDDQITEALIERAKNREEQKNMIPSHVSTCPNLNEIRGCRIKIENVETKMESLEKQLEDAFFFVRHPKLFIGTLVVIVVLTLATFLSNNPLKVFNKDISILPQQEQTE